MADKKKKDGEQNPKLEALRKEAIRRRLKGKKATSFIFSTLNEGGVED